MSGFDPGRQLGAQWGHLRPLDPAELSNAERIDALIACQRLVAWAEAQALRVLAAMSPSVEQSQSAATRAEKEFLFEEIRCALRQSATAVAHRVHLARELDTRLRDTWRSLAAGDITVGHASALSDAVAALPNNVAASVQQQVLVRAPRQTPGHSGPLSPARC